MLDSSYRILRHLLIAYRDEEVEPDNALRWISQFVGDTHGGLYPLEPPDEKPVLLEESDMKKPETVRRPRNPSHHVNGPSWGRNSLTPCFLCQDDPPRLYDPEVFQICKSCRKKLHEISRSFGMGSSIRLDEDDDGTGLKLTLANEVEDTAQALVYGMSRCPVTGGK
jgi:hypothetical protein